MAQQKLKKNVEDYRHLTSKNDVFQIKKKKRVKCTVGPLTFGRVSSGPINFQTAFLGPLTFGGVLSRSINFQIIFLGP